MIPHHLKGDLFRLNPPARATLLLHIQLTLNRSLPDEYASFLLTANGGEGRVGSQHLWLWQADDLICRNEQYEVSSFAPGLFLFGSDGGGEAFGFDMRIDLWSIVRVPLIDIDWSNAVMLASSFENFITCIAKAS
jgi:hypothetical protein